MIRVRIKGDGKKTRNWFLKNSRGDISSELNRYGSLGVRALSEATPVDSRLTAKSWTYKVVKTTKGVKILWSNTNIEDGQVVAILIQYGHGTRQGGYVQGRDYINPAIQPLFDRIAEEVWGKVVRDG